MSQPDPVDVARRLSRALDANDFETARLLLSRASNAAREYAISSGEVDLVFLAERSRPC